MDKIEKYKKILKAELEYQVSIPYANAATLESQLIVNDTETQFIVINFGWINKIFRHGLVYHFEIKGDKIWLYRNNTDIDIGERLVNKGIPKSAIVIGFLGKLERTVEGYAAA